MKLKYSLTAVDVLLTGSLDKGLGSLTTLVSLNLSRNSFTGTLPAFWDFPAMRTLNLTDTKLHGSIPEGKPWT